MARTIVVVHRTRRDGSDIMGGVERDHWCEGTVCWCAPIVLTTDDKKFSEKVGVSALPELGKIGDGVVVIDNQEEVDE